MISIITGLPGSGKSYLTALRSVQTLERNVEWYHKSGIKRLVVTNLRLNPNIEATYGLEDEGGFIKYWDDPQEISRLRDCDLFWEEMGATVDSRMWESLPLEMRRFLQQHRHRGVEIIGNVQEFADVDVSVRRLTEELLYLTKIMGSRDPSPTSPPIKRIWGIILKMRINPKNYKEDMKFVEGNFAVDGFMFISKKIIELYDMRNDIKPGKFPPLQHRVRVCEDEECGYKKIIHI